MTEFQGWIIIGLLGFIVITLYVLIPIIERVVGVIVHQRELLQDGLSNFDDDHLKFELSVFLEEANKPIHAATRRSLEERGIKLPKQ